MAKKDTDLSKHEKDRLRSASLRRRTNLPSQRQSTPSVPRRSESRRKAFKDTDAVLNTVDSKTAKAKQNSRDGLDWEVTDEERERIADVESEVDEHDMVNTTRRKIARGLRGALLLFSGLVTCVALYAVYAFVWKKDEPTVVEDPIVNTTFTVSKKSVSEVIESYLAAPTWRDRLQFVRHPERVAPRMETYYQKHPLETGPIGTLKMGGALVRSDAKSWVAFLTLTPELQIGIPSDVMTVGLRPTEEGLKIDWESMVRYCEMSFEEILEKRPSDPVEIRVKLREADYYNFLYADKEKYACYKLSDSPDTEFCYGYALRGGPVHETLASFLRERTDANPFVVHVNPTISVKVEPGSESGKQVRISSVISKYWMVEDEPVVITD